MADKKPTKEQYAKFKARANDKSISAEARATFKKLVDKFKSEFETAEKEVEKVVEDKPKAKRGRKPSTSTPKKRGRKPSAKKEQSADDIAKAKAEIKKRTGKTEEECESIIEEYKSLRTKAQTRRKAETKAKEDNTKRINKLKKDDNIIAGTTEKTADAVIETNTKDIAEKIEKEIEKVEDKAEREETAKAKKEVEKTSPNKSATEKKKEVKKKVEAKVEKKVKAKTKVVVKKVIIDTTAMLSSIAESLGKFDKDSQKEFLMKLRSDIDKLLAKYMYGGDVSGATQQLDIAQSNLSSSSVNPSKFARGGGIMADGRIVLRDFNGIGGNKNKTYKLIKDDRDSDGKPYYTLIEYPSGNVLAQGDSFEEVNGYANLMSGKFARGGGIMTDGRIVLRDFNGIGGNKNKTYKLIKDDRDGKPYYTLIEYPSGNVMAQGDGFEEVNMYANLMSGKFARGGGMRTRRPKYMKGGRMKNMMRERRGM